MKFFAKELPQQSFWFADGTKLNYDAVNNALGVVRLDDEADADKVAQLQLAVTSKKGGVLSLTEVEYEAKKKALLSVGSGRPSASTLAPFRMVTARMPEIVERSVGVVSEPARSQVAAAPAELPGAQIVEAQVVPEPVRKLSPSTGKR
jgi:hypothetical protein